MTGRVWRGSSTGRARRWCRSCLRCGRTRCFSGGIGGIALSIEAGPRGQARGDDDGEAGGVGPRVRLGVTRWGEAPPASGRGDNAVPSLQVPPVILALVERFELVLDLKQAFELAGFLPVAAAQLDEGGVGVVVEWAVELGALAGGDFGKLHLHRLDLLQAYVDRREVFDDRGVQVVLLGAGEGGGGYRGGDADRAHPRPLWLRHVFDSPQAGGEKVPAPRQPLGPRIELARGEAIAAFVAGVHPEAEHQQPVVADAAEALELAGDEYQRELAVDRAFVGDVLQALDAEVERRFPRAAEAFRAGT